MAGFHEVDPISRIEGHLGIHVDVGSGGTIQEAWAHGNLWRGFENFLIGRDVNDAITVTQRICGVCPIPHATASMFSAESALGINEGMITFAIGSTDQPKGVPAKAVLIRNLIYASEFVMSAITHFYHLAALSYVQGPPVPPWTPFYPDDQYDALGKLISLHHGANADGTPAGASDRGVLPLKIAGTGATVATAASPTTGGTGLAGYSADLWSAVIKQYVKALRIRRLTFEAGALFAGRMPMTSSFVAGGVTVKKGDGDLKAKCDLFRSIFEEIGSFVVREYIPVAFALSALYPGYDNTGQAGSYGEPGNGAGVKNFLSWGAFPGIDTAGTLLFPGGYFVSGVNTDPKAQRFMLNSSSPKKAVGTIAPSGAVQLVKDSLSEFIARSAYVSDTAWGYASGAVSGYPGDIVRTEPDRNIANEWTTGKYSWLKAPRWKVGGTYFPMEVGPLARQAIAGVYPVDGTSAILGYNGNGLDGVYVVNGHLDGKCIHPDLAGALAADGLATIAVAPTTIVSGGSTDSARFTDGEFAGTVVGWIAGLKGGFSVMDRHRARAVEAYRLVAAMIGGFDKTVAATKPFNNETNDGDASGGWISQLWGLADTDPNGETYHHYAPPTTTGNHGIGVSEAPRGALAHFCTTDGTKIMQYQCVVPTTWNASPKDGPTSGATPGSNAAVNNTSSTKRGPMEQAMIGMPFDETDQNAIGTLGAASFTVKSGIEVLRVAQSFDPCIACAVH